jgi:hypothetical protein
MLEELVGKGWVLVRPPLDRDEESVVARYRGEKIKAGFVIEERNGDDEVYVKFRSGQYDLEVKIDFLARQGELRVSKAPGYVS